MILYFAFENLYDLFSTVSQIYKSATAGEKNRHNCEKLKQRCTQYKSENNKPQFPLMSLICLNGLLHKKGNDRWQQKKKNTHTQCVGIEDSKQKKEPKEGEGIEKEKEKEKKEKRKKAKETQAWKKKTIGLICLCIMIVDWTLMSKLGGSYDNPLFVRYVVNSCYSMLLIPFCVITYSRKDEPNFKTCYGTFNLKTNCSDEII
ncbi:hypothetical protein RFI_09405 [Reticulomyxa filosa]|uniref:TMEM62 C-terminal domain-containing protein n=1 Tax=Reticulomyxa filosa TaxID=46433 RepID=X6NNX6_RETFI|nr:hypothetical protein RFI_09405 [Reticulomyxa filosa]|eukprot:ETO27726.1 hypothetical protein RFI_09405 [Reticulomyxa filosa]